jgi:type IV pilus assembly protein PilM
MISLTKQRSVSRPRGKGVVGLDIEAGSIAATELSINGSVNVEHFGIGPLGSGAVRDGEVHEPAELAEAIKGLFGAQKLPRDVRVGIANQRVAVRTLRLPQIDNKDELATAVRFAAQDHIPMPLDRAVLDWRVIPNQAEGDLQMEVVVVAARREMLANLIEGCKRGGLRLVGIDHSAFALIRALAGRSSDTPGGPIQLPAVEPAPVDPAADPAAPAVAAPIVGQLYCHLGDVTNLAVARGSFCLFSRVLGFGIEGIAQTLAATSGLTLEYARQWLIHVGIESPVEEIEGDPTTVGMTREALATGLATLVEELRRSLDYYAGIDGSVQVDSVVVAGPGTAIPGLVAKLERELPLPLVAAVPSALTSVAGAAASRLTLSYGLGLEE